MTACRLTLIFSAFTSGACLCLSAGLSAAKLVDDIIARPGHWSQMCASPPPIPADVPLPLYSLAAARHFGVSSASVEKLRKNRTEVVLDLRARLKVVDLTRPTFTKASGRYDTDSGQDPRQFSGLLLSIIRNLDAIETLPELLTVEAMLDFTLAVSPPTSTNVFPGLDLDSPAVWDLKWATNQPQVSAQVFTARVLQRETLSIMADLLRNRKYGPLLASEMERLYADHLRREAAKPPLQGIRAPADVPKDMREWVRFDPIHNLPVSPQRGGVSMAYSPALRLQIRGWAEDYLKAHPELVP